MAKMTQKQLKKHLLELSEEELREEILRLYTTIPLVKEYFQLGLGSPGNFLQAENSAVLLPEGPGY